MEEVCIIIPAWGEEKVIKDVLDSVCGKFQNVICINDGSRDNTSKEVRKTKAFVIDHPVNLGQGAGLQTGIEFALQNKNIKYFVTFDADGQHGLDDVMLMIEELKKHDLDMVLGSRFLGKVENIKTSKKIILKLAIQFSNLMSGVKLTDTHNGLRVFNRHVAETLNITMPDFAHASEIIERIREMNYKYKEFPVTITYSDYSKAKGQSLVNAINIGFDVMLRRITKK